MFLDINFGLNLIEYAIRLVLIFCYSINIYFLWVFFSNEIKTFFSRVFNFTKPPKFAKIYYPRKLVSLTFLYTFSDNE